MEDNPRKIFPSALEDANVCEVPRPPLSQTLSPSYRLAYADKDFLMRDELRAVRLELELMKPELIQQEHRIESTIVVFGSSKVPDPETARRNLEELKERLKKDPQDAVILKERHRAERRLANSCYYQEARRLSAIISSACQNENKCNLVVITGGGPGIMEAANRGAYDVGAKSMGLNIVIPHEQAPNSYITPELCFQFHYFAIRKMHFLMRAFALVVFPGGYGTMDELFETLTLIQTGKIKPIPVILFGREFWKRAIDFDFFVSEGVISEKDIGLLQFVESAEEAWEIISGFYEAND